VARLLSVIIIVVNHLSHQGSASRVLHLAFETQLQSRRFT